MPSGFVFNEDGTMSYVVNVQYYEPNDDETCFYMSCKFHKMENKALSDRYKIMRANVEWGKDFNVMVDFVEDGKEEFRVYRILDQ